MSEMLPFQKAFLEGLSRGANFQGVMFTRSGKAYVQQVIEARRLMEKMIDSTLKVAELNHLWWGVSIGGKHYTGNVILNYPHRCVEMTRTLSAREAKEMAEQEGRLWLARERTTNKFDSLKQLERFAARWCEANLGENWVLLAGDRLNPCVAIAGKGWVRANLKSMTRLGKAWDKVPDSQRDFDNPAIKNLYRVWKSLFQP